MARAKSSAKAKARPEVAAVVPEVVSLTEGMRTRKVPIGKLIPYAQNARTHSKKQIGQLVDSLKTFGWMTPVIIDADNGIIAGHGRVLAAKKLGLTHVPCVERAHLTEAQRRGYILADNKLAEQAGWDSKLLTLELGDLAEMGQDLKVIGFKPSEIRKWAPDAPVAQEDDDTEPEPAPTPEPPLAPVSRPGDLWLLGSHRVLCGDATRKADVTRLLDGGLPPIVMVTDPPYGVEYDADWRNKAKEHLDSIGHARAVGKVENDDRADWREAWELFPGDVAYVWHSALHASIVDASLAAAEFHVRAQIIWAKQSLVVSRGHYHWKHEPCWYAVRKGGTAHWQGDCKQATVWDIQNGGAFGRKSEDDTKTVHSTQKPVACMLRPIRNHTVEGEAVYDPFLGSGTTVIAAHQAERVAYGLELNPAYVDVIVERWQNLAGASAVLDGDGRTFAEVAAERRSAEPPADGAADPDAAEAAGETEAA